MELTDEPLYLQIYKLKENIIKSKKPKYNLILRFVNELFKSKYVSLKDLNKMDYEKMDLDAAEIILSDYKNNLEKTLNIEIDDDDDIITILRNCLESIEYSLNVHKIKNKYDDENKIFITIRDSAKKEYDNKKFDVPIEFKEIMANISKNKQDKSKKNKKDVLNFLNEISEQNVKVIKKLTIKIKNLDDDLFNETLDKYIDIFDFEINKNHKIIRIIEKCIWEIGYIVKRDNDEISFIKNE